MNNLTNPEYIRAITPLILAIVGLAIGAIVILKPELVDTQTKIKNFTNPEYVRAMTPLILAIVGCAIGAMVLFNPELAETQWTAGIGLASTAITGAAGLAQSNSSNQ